MSYSTTSGEIQSSTYLPNYQSPNNASTSSFTFDITANLEYEFSSRWPTWAVFSPSQNWAHDLWLSLWLMGVEWQVVLLLRRRLQTHQSAGAWASLPEECMTSDTVASHLSGGAERAEVMQVQNQRPAPNAFPYVTNGFPSKQVPPSHEAFIK